MGTWVYLYADGSRLLLPLEPLESSIIQWCKDHAQIDEGFVAVQPSSLNPSPSPSWVTKEEMSAYREGRASYALCQRMERTFRFQGGEVARALYARPDSIFSEFWGFIGLTPLVRKQSIPTESSALVHHPRLVETDR